MKKTLKNAVKGLQIIIDESGKEVKAKEILIIKTKPILKAVKDGAELNDGYEFEVNGALPEIADGIAKLAIELPKNEFGFKSDEYFIGLINDYFRRLKN